MAAGPNLVFGDAYYHDEFVTESRSAFGVGGYARTGLEIRMADRSFLGFGARFVTDELGFGGLIGDVNVEGWQWFVTYTIGL